MKIFFLSKRSLVSGLFKIGQENKVKNADFL